MATLVQVETPDGGDFNARTELGAANKETIKKVIVCFMASDKESLFIPIFLCLFHPASITLFEYLSHSYLSHSVSFSLSASLTLFECLSHSMYLFHSL